MTADYSKDMFAAEGDSARITLGLAEDLRRYTPTVSERAIVALAEEYRVSPERILTALKRWWFETVQDQLNSFEQRVGELSYDPEAATHFAQRFL